MGEGGAAYTRTGSTPALASLLRCVMSFLKVFIVGAVTLSLSSNLPRSFVRHARDARLSRGGGGGGGGDGGGGGGAGSNSSVGVGTHHGELRRCHSRLPTGSPHLGQEPIGRSTRAAQLNFR